MVLVTASGAVLVLLTLSRDNGFASTVGTVFWSTYKKCTNMRFGKRICWVLHRPDINVF